MGQAIPADVSLRKEIGDRHPTLRRQPTGVSPPNLGFSARLLDDERRAFAICPFAHRAVVVSCSVVTQELQNKHSVRRTDATLSIGNNLLVRRGSDLFEHCPQIFRRLYRLVTVVCDEVQPFEMNGARYATRPGIPSGVTAVPLTV